MWRRPVANLLIEFGPVTAFFISYKLKGFFVAIATIMIATFIAVAIALIRDRRLALFPLFGFFMVTIFGSLSLFVRDADLFILRDTIADLTFGTILLASLILHKPALKPMFEATMAITDEGWWKLTFRWMIVYFVIGFSNEIVRRTYSDHFWVFFKAFTVGISILFALYQFRLTARTRIPTESNTWGFRINTSEVQKTVSRTDESTLRPT